MDTTIISKHRNAIYGFAILWIVIFHGSAINEVDYSFGQDYLVPLKCFIEMGNIGVDVFLFLSGVCLYFSFTRNPDIAAFFKRRFERLLPAAYLVFTGWWAYQFLIRDFLPADFATRMTLMRFWMTGDGAIWFVSLIIVPIVSLFTPSVPFEIEPPLPTSGTDREYARSVEGKPEPKLPADAAAADMLDVGARN